MHLHREVLAAAERTADTAEMDPHLLEREPEAGRDLRPVDVQPLRRDVDVDAAFAVGDGEAGLGAEERLILDADVVHALDRDVGRRVGVAVADHHVPHDVRPVVLAVAVTTRRLLGMEVGQLRRALHVGDRIERLVLDDDPLGGAACLLRMLGRHQRHRFAVVEDAVDREHRLIRELEPVRLLPGHVVVRQHRVHAGHRHGLRDVDRDDARVRVRAAQRVPPEHARGDQVARIRELALHLRWRIDARDEVADLAHLQRACRGLRHDAPAASRTASKILA